MQKLVVTILFSVLVVCCKQSVSPKFEFDKDGVSFSGPAGWKISDEENFDNMGYYLSIEKDGFDSSGLITITWVNDSLELQDYIKMYQDELRNNPIYTSSNLNFEPIILNKYNTIDSKSSSYTMSLLGVKHEGIIHSFYGKNKSIILLEQEAIEDRAENESGFDQIETSFSLEQ